jgi:hypothetical protein
MEVDSITTEGLVRGRYATLVTPGCEVPPRTETRKFDAASMGISISEKWDEMPMKKRWMK